MKRNAMKWNRVLVNCLSILWWKWAKFVFHCLESKNRANFKYFISFLPLFRKYNHVDKLHNRNSSLHSTYFFKKIQPIEHNSISFVSTTFDQSKQSLGIITQLMSCFCCHWSSLYVASSYHWPLSCPMPSWHDQVSGSPSFSQTFSTYIHSDHPSQAAHASAETTPHMPGENCIHKERFVRLE